MRTYTTIASLLLLVTTVFFIYRCNRDYYKEYNLVKNEFAKIGNIEVVSIGGNPDVALEDISATIKLKNGHLIDLYGLTQGDFHQTDGITLMRINNWRFHLTGCVRDGAWGGSGITIGNKSEYKAIRDLQIKNVKDLVDKYEYLYKVILKVAVQPSFDTLIKNNETVYIQKYDEQTFTHTEELKWAGCK